RVDARSLNIDRESAELARARDPGVELLQAAHDLVAGALDFGIAGGRDARGGARLRRELGFGVFHPARRARLYGWRQRKGRLLRGLRLARRGARRKLAVRLGGRRVDAGELRRAARGGARL